MKLWIFPLFVLSLASCAKSGDAASSEATSCQTLRSTHTGCCSSHGGFGGQCGSGQALYGSQSGKLVCNDGSFSPSCTYSLNPLESLLIDYENTHGITESQ